MVILYRVIAVLIGYVFGLFQTGYIYGRSKGIDIRQHGSGNSGSTNTLRVLGKKAGAITFIGDFAKCALAMVVVWLIFKWTYPDWVKVLTLYAGLGAVLGHNYPFYLKFKGGKGIACTAAIVILACPQAAPLCFLSFALIVIFTQYVSLGSIIGVLLFLVQVFIFFLNGIFLHLESNYACEYVILSFIFVALAIIRHRANIVRLCKGTENKLWTKKKKSEEDK